MLVAVAVSGSLAQVHSNSAHFLKPTLKQQLEMNLVVFDIDVTHRDSVHTGQNNCPVLHNRKVVFCYVLLLLLCVCTCVYELQNKFNPNPPPNPWKCESPPVRPRC